MSLVHGALSRGPCAAVPFLSCFHAALQQQADGVHVASSGRPVQGRAVVRFGVDIRAMVEQYRAKLANFGRAYLLLGLAEADQPKSDSYVSRLLNDLAAGVLPSANGNHWEDEYYRGSTHTNTRTTGLVLDALVRADSTHPLIEETVGSDRLASPGAQDDDEAATRVTAVAPTSTSPQVQSPVRHTEKSKPQLNWTNVDGQLNEVAAGRVAVVPPPAHSRQE